MQQKNRTGKKDARFIVFVFLNSLAIIIWTVYLFNVQILDPFNLERDRLLRYNPKKELSFPLRGNILDANGELLVRTTEYYQIDFDRSVLSNYRNNSEVTEALRNDYHKLADIFSSSTSLDRNYVLERFLLKSNPSIYISDRISKLELYELENSLAKERLQGGLLSKFSFQQREYPQNTLAARLLGSVRSPGSSSSTSLSMLVGTCGIEEIYNDELQGVYGWRKFFVDARNKPVFIPNLRNQAVKNGNNIRLTIDSRIQQIVEDALSEGLEKFQAKNAIGIFLNPKTGEIVAMATLSADDKKRASAEIRAMANYGVSYMFEPGSTIKPFTALAALDNKVFKSTDMLDCRTYNLSGRTIKDAHPFDDLSFKDVIVHSSNVGTAKIAERLGARRLYQQLISLGFGNRTGTDFYGESAGLFRKLKDWQGFSLHSISFGQEIAVTPLQLAVSYGALANDGILMRPYLVKEILDDQGKVLNVTKPQAIRTVAGKAAIDSLKVILQDTVEYGTGTRTKLPYVSVAGKTGTAEKKIEGVKGYAKNKYIPNFAGFFPTENPQYVGVVIYDEPAYVYHYASMSAAVTYRKIIEGILALPDNDIILSQKMQKTNYISMPNLIGLEQNEAITALKNSSISYRIVYNDPKNESKKYKASPSDLKVVDQYPKENIRFDSQQSVIIVIRDQRNEDNEIVSDKNKMPALVGQSVRSAIRIAKQHNVNLIVNGKGIIATQSIPANSDINYGDTCKVAAN